LIKLNKLFINNFLSVNKLEYAFEEKGLILISGVVEDSGCSDSNGAGKSTLVDAICWSLFDKTLRGISKDEVVNRFYNKDCSVVLEFYLDEIPYKITRYRKHSTNKNLVQLVQNGIDVTSRSDSDTNLLIEKTLGFDFNQFQLNLVFTNTSLKFLSLGNTERKKVFDDIVDSNFYEQASFWFKERSNGLLAELNSTRQALEIKTSNFKKDETNYEELVLKSKEFHDKQKEEIHSLIDRMSLAKDELRKLEGANVSYIANFDSFILGKKDYQKKEKESKRVQLSEQLTSFRNNLEMCRHRLF